MIYKAVGKTSQIVQRKLKEFNRDKIESDRI